MKRLAYAALTVMGLAGHAQAQDVPGLVTIITSEDAQTRLMGMDLTMQAVQQGAEAHIMLCGPAGDLALMEPPASATAPQQPRGTSPQGLMRQVMEAGPQIEVCAVYLPNKGADPEVLLDGISPADPAAMAARLLAPNVRILTF